MLVLALTFSGIQAHNTMLDLHRLALDITLILVTGDEL